jgi:predicted secreted protein
MATPGLKFKGRNFLIKKEDTPGSNTWSIIAGMRTSALTINNAQIDVTDKEGAPFRQLLSGGIKSLSLTGAGVMKDATATRTLLAAVLATDGTDILNFQLVSDFGDKFQGAFQVVGFDRSGDVKAEEIYTIKLESAGVIAYTAAP